MAARTRWTGSSPIWTADSKIIVLISNVISKIIGSFKPAGQNVF